MNYAIQKAQIEELQEILAIYAYARTFMAENGNPNQWGKTNPPREILEADIAAGNLYCVKRDSTICGVFFFSMGKDPTYAEIFDWQWLSEAPYATIHRVASNGSGGIFRACVEFCLAQCAHLRIDTHHDNRIMQHVIEKAGFRRCGIIYIGDGTPRIAYERV